MEIQKLKNLPTVCCVTCTKGRHSFIERVLGMILKQDYKGKIVHLIYNNSLVSQELAPNVSTENREIILINQYRYSKTNEFYKGMSEISEDALSYIPAEVEVVTFMDDDDIYLDNHISEGVKGYLDALNLNKLAYKPFYSLMDSTEGRTKINNVCEPSIFVFKDFLVQAGFDPHSSAYHHQWIRALTEGDLLHEAVDGIPTFVYQWMGDVYHMSGNGDNPDNLDNFRKTHQDEGDLIITPTGM